jgi:hypothetical protein
MWPDKIDQKMMDRHLKFWFGHPNVHVGWIKHDLEEAIQSATMIGCWRGKGRNDFWRYPARYLADIGRPPDCGIDIHRQMLGSGVLARFIQDAEHVVLVTCRDIEKRFAKRYNKTPIVINIPEEGRTLKRPNDHWEQYGDIREEIAGVARPGDVWLVGAGVLGKIYTVDAALSGAIALDIGSIFDGWAGVRSRSYIDPREMRL